MALKRPALGQLNERVTLQSRVSAANAGGGATESFTDLATVWAAIDLLRGGRYVAGLQVEEVATHAIVVRVFAAWRQVKYIAWRDRRLRVVAAGEDARRFVEYLAVEA